MGNMLTLGNSKLKATAAETGAIVAAFSLPAQSTCPKAGACRAFCYASCGTFRFKSVFQHATENYHKSLSDAFILEMGLEIEALRVKAKKKAAKLVIRLHDSGDFYSKAYAEAWRLIMLANPDVEFYAYSKSWVMAMDVFKDTPNMTVIPSEGGLDDHLLGERPRAYVFAESGEPRVNTVEGKENDLFNLRTIQGGVSIGLRAHGVRKGKVAA